MDSTSALRVNYDSFSTRMVFRTSKRVGVAMRDLGDTTAYLRRGIREILCLALFFFTFLAGEYFFDVRVAEFVPANEVVIYESIVVGASVIGYFVRPLLYYRRPQTIDATSDITGVLLVSALLLLIMAAQFQVVIAGGLVACCDHHHILVAPIGVQIGIGRIDGVQSYHSHITHLLSSNGLKASSVCITSQWRESMPTTVMMSNLTSASMPICLT